MMSFTDSVCKGIENLFSAKGRMSRSCFWWFALFCVLVDTALAFLILIATQPSATTATIINLIFDLTIWYIFIVPGIRRLHDIGKAGTNVLWILLPFVGWIYLIYLFCQPSYPMENYYGEPVH